MFFASQSPFDEKEFYSNRLARLTPSYVDILSLIEREEQPTTTVEYAQHFHENMRGPVRPNSLVNRNLALFSFLGDLQQVGLTVAISYDPFYARLRARQPSGKPGGIAVMRKLLVRYYSL